MVVDPEVDVSYLKSKWRPLYNFILVPTVAASGIEAFVDGSHIPLYLMFQLLQSATHRAALKNHLKAKSNPECSSLDITGILPI